MVRASALAVLLACLAFASSARADGPLEDLSELEESPRPPSLPELTRPRPEAEVELTSGTFSPRSTSAVRGHVPVSVVHLGAEFPIAGRQIFVGGAYDFAYGNPEAASSMRTLGGNTLLYGRAVWATRTGLTFGGGLGAVVPTTAFDRASPIQSLATAAVALRPWDISLFEDRALAFEPFVDMRYVVSGFTLQVRQAFDGSFDLRGMKGTRIFAIATVYLGYRLAEPLLVGIEGSELYFLEADVADERRAFFSFTPAVRLLFHHLEPSLGFITSIGPPLVPGTDRLLGARVGLGAVF